MKNTLNQRCQRHEKYRIAMTLLEIYKTKPERLVTVAYSDFDDAQWQDLAIYLGSNQKDPYNSEVIQQILPIIGNRLLWLTTTSAQQFLYTAIFNNDAKMARFILENFDNVRNGKGVIEEWMSYIETTLEMLHDVATNERNYSVLDVLFEHFKDDGSGVWFCVRKSDRDLFDRVLPNTDAPGANTVTAYCWATVYGLSEFQQILEPISCKIEALYEYELTQDWFDLDKKDVVTRMSNELYEQIVEGSYDSETPVQLFKEFLNDPCNWEQIDFTCLSSLCLQKMVLLLRERNTVNARALISYIDVFDDETSHVIALRFKDTPHLIVPRLSNTSRQKELCACARRSDKEFSQHLVAYGADLHQALEELSAKKGWHNSNDPFIKDIVEHENKAASVVQHWINEEQAQTIANALDAGDGKTSTRKL